MGQARLPVRKIREVLRLKAEGYSDRQIARSIGSARSTVQECVRRSRAAGVHWPLPAGLDETALHAQLYQRSVPLSRTPQPDFACIQAELKRRGVTRMLLWEEYKNAHPDGWQYSVFCDQYRRWLARQDVVLRQEHLPGDKGFVDYAGQTVPITDRLSGEVRQAQVFIAVLGCSNYTYAEATWTQALPDWLGSHVRATEYFGGSPAAWVPDNLKSAVTKARRYEPELNPAYQEFAEHYGVAILPARVRKPRDKAKVENGVLIAERWILARLRHCTFFSLAELNTAIAALLERMNTRAFTKLAGCRRSRFLELDRPALRALPPRRYEFAQWRKAKVHPDYHVEVMSAYYSVPYRLIGERVDVRLTAGAVEIFHHGALIAAHARATERSGRSTHSNHRPDRHVAVIEHTMARTLTWAGQIGPATVAVIQNQAARRKHPEETLRSAQGILRLAKDFSPNQLEAACVRALVLGSYSYRTVRTLVENPAAPAAQPALNLLHENVRGREYFQ
ncbi:MAG: IS21 family transposase [Rhodobacteraceae bacterium]|nr:IS21 family transposase [Paracoccaceae bacterium]